MGNAIINWLGEWWPWLAIAILPGIVNLAVAFQELEEECRFLPFFEPFSSLGVWVWAFFQLLFPAVFFWMLVSLSEQPKNFLTLLLEALGFGFGFVALLNSRTEIGAKVYDLKNIYTIIVGVAYQMIARRQTSRTAQFWTDVEESLEESSDLEPGFRFLENYFASDISLKFEDKQLFQKRLMEAEKNADLSVQVRAAKNLLREVRRQDLADALQRFGAHREMLKQYFR